MQTETDFLRLQVCILKVGTHTHTGDGGGGMLWGNAPLCVLHRTLVVGTLYVRWWMHSALRHKIAKRTDGAWELSSMKLFIVSFPCILYESYQSWENESANKFSLKVPVNRVCEETNSESET